MHKNISEELTKLKCIKPLLFYNLILQSKNNYYIPNDSLQDALHFGNRISVQIYKFTGFIFLTLLEILWLQMKQYND